MSKKTRQKPDEARQYGEKVWQEFYCNDCCGCMRAKLNMALNQRVEVVCPNCKRHHPRFIINGQIKENGGNYDDPVEVILIPMSDYSKEPFSTKIKPNARDGAVIEGQMDLSPAGEHLLRERWFELYGG